MRILQNRWAIWLGLAGVLLGAILYPLYVVFQTLMQAVTIAGQVQPITIVSNPFLDLLNGKSIPLSGTQFVFLLAILGANLGGILGVVLGLIISK